MPADREKAYLWDMLDAALAVDEFVRGKTYKDYLSNRMMRGAVERYVEIIGEAARRISESTRQAIRKSLGARLSASATFWRTNTTRW